MKRQRFLLLIAITLISALVVVLFLHSRPSPPLPSATPTPTVVGWKGVIPGTSSAQEVERLLGTPVKIVPEKNLVTYHYSIPAKRATDQVIFTNNTTGVIKIWPKDADNRSLVSALKNYAETPAVLYGPDSSSGILLHLLPGSGVAFLANPRGDLIFETWYFALATTEGFLSSPWGQKYNLNEQQRED